MKLNDKLEKLCSMRRWKQADLAAALRVSKATVNYWWHGTGRPDLEASLAIAKLLDVDLDWFADDDRDWPPPVGQLSFEEELVLREYREALVAALDRIETHRTIINAIQDAVRAHRGSGGGQGCDGLSPAPTPESDPLPPSEVHGYAKVIAHRDLTESDMNREREERRPKRPPPRKK